MQRISETVRVVASIIFGNIFFLVSFALILRYLAIFDLTPMGRFIRMAGEGRIYGESFEVLRTQSDIFNSLCILPVLSFLTGILTARIGGHIWTPLLILSVGGFILFELLGMVVGSLHCGRMANLTVVVCSLLNIPLMIAFVLLGGTVAKKWLQRAPVLL